MPEKIGEIEPSPPAPSRPVAHFALQVIETILDKIESIIDLPKRRERADRIDFLDDFGAERIKFLEPLLQSKIGVHPFVDDPVEGEILAVGIELLEFSDSAPELALELCKLFSPVPVRRGHDGIIRAGVLSVTRFFAQRDRASA